MVFHCALGTVNAVVGAGGERFRSRELCLRACTTLEKRSRVSQSSLRPGTASAITPSGASSEPSGLPREYRSAALSAGICGGPASHVAVGDGESRRRGKSGMRM